MRPRRLSHRLVAVSVPPRAFLGLQYGQQTHCSVSMDGMCEGDRLLVYR